MVLLVNGNELNVNNAYTERDTVTNKLYLIVDVPYGEVEYGALKAIFKTNTEIVKIDDYGNTNLFEGFIYSPDYPPQDIENSGIYRFKLIGNENTYQATRNRELEAKVKDKDNQISSLNDAIAERNNEITNMTASITEKDGTIEVQATTIEEQKAVIAEKEAQIVEKDTVISEQAVDLVNLNEEMLVMAEEYADVMFELATLKLAQEETVVKDAESEVL